MPALLARAIGAATLACALAPAPGLAAGPVYKTVGPDGKITYTDRAAAASSPAGKGGELSLAAVRRDPAAAVFNPTFFTSRGEVRAGKAFLAQVATCPGVFLVSALHLFGPAGGVGVQMTPAELGTAVTRIALSNIATGDAVPEVKAVSVTPAQATPCCQGGAPQIGNGDIAAFLGPLRRDLALPVASAPVKRGDRVYVVTSLAGGKTGTVRFEAIARGIERGYLAYDFLEPGFALRATSGAPVLNAAGEVVAINLGGSTQEGSGRTSAIGNPASAWRDALAATCRN